MTPLIYVFVLGLFSCSGWHLEPGLGAAYWESGPNDVISEGVLFDVRLKKDPVVEVTVEPTPVTVIAPSGVELAVSTHAHQEPEAEEDSVDKALDAGSTIDEWGWDTKLLLGVLGLALLAGGAWLISKDKMPFIKRNNKKEKK